MGMKVVNRRRPESIRVPKKGTLRKHVMRPLSVREKRKVARNYRHTQTQAQKLEKISKEMKLSVNEIIFQFVEQGIEEYEGRELLDPK